MAVHLCSVNQAHAKLDSQTQRHDFSGTRALAFAHAPRALAEQRNALAVRECDGSHLNSIASAKRETGRNPFTPEAFTYVSPIEEWTYGMSGRKILCSLLTL